MFTITIPVLLLLVVVWLLLLLLPPPSASKGVEHDGFAAATPAAAATAAVPLVRDGQVHGEAELVLVLMGLVLLRGTRVLSNV